MARTVDFYTNVLGMPLIKTLEIPGGGPALLLRLRQRRLARLLLVPGRARAAPGIASAADLPGSGDISTAHGSMNHVAFDVPPEKFDEYVERLSAKGVDVSPVVNHDDSERTIAAELHPGVFVRSVYFQDPDGILLEFACWTREFGPEDVHHAPANAEGERVALVASS